MRARYLSSSLPDLNIIWQSGARSLHLEQTSTSARTLGSENPDRGSRFAVGQRLAGSYLEQDQISVAANALMQAFVVWHTLDLCGIQAAH